MNRVPLRGLLGLALVGALVSACTGGRSAEPSPMVSSRTVTEARPSAPSAPCDAAAMQAFEQANQHVLQAYCADGAAPGAKRPTQWALVLWESGPAGGESTWVYLSHTSAMICGNTTSCWTPADPSIDGMWAQYSQGQTRRQLSGSMCSGGGALNLRQLASCVPDDAAATIWVAMRAAQQTPG